MLVVLVFLLFFIQIRNVSAFNPLSIASSSEIPCSNWGPSGITEGTKVCLAGSVYICQDGLATLNETCSYACRNGKCICGEGRKKCVDNSVYVCENGEFIFQTRCSFKCVDKYLEAFDKIASMCQERVCEEGEIRCSSMDEVQQCDYINDAWITLKKCDYKCENNECVTNPVYYVDIVLGFWVIFLFWVLIKKKKWLK